MASIGQTFAAMISEGRRGSMGENHTMTLPLPKDPDH